MTKLRRLFIANRGEIARRIATTARRMGIESVAVTDRPDHLGPPAYLLGVVTDFVRVAEESPKLYLDGDRMIMLAVQSGCDSVHPGFGFLSENAGFAQKVLDAGLVWVGPKPAAIDAMASKATARAHAETAGVPCIRGLSSFPVPADATGDFSALEAFADEAGYPLLIKAAMGGGGKGMRQVYKKSELREAALRARSEAVNSFGDGALICEQYLTAPRHVEVQILADKQGTTLAIGDRDCSVQRRHQKIVEEAPAPALTDATRAAIHDAAVRLAAAVGYDSTGTVEFLVDWSDSSRDAPLQRFYFLEMNTRLQVEHPVTEEVFGIDLVEWQLRVAAGESLPPRFRTLQPRGHSVEVRIYAEDVANAFFPAPGPVGAFRPAQGPGLRWEVGLDEVDEVTGRFDPMIAKLVATAETRAGALERLAEGLARTVFAGPAANIELLRELATQPPFASGPVTTHYLTTGLEPLLRRIETARAVHESGAQALLDLLSEGRLGGLASVDTVDARSLTIAAFADGGSAAHRTSAAATGAPALSWRAYVPALTPTGGAVQSGEGLYAPSSAGADARPVAFWYAALKSGTDQQLWVAIDGRPYRRQRAKTGRAGSGDGDAAHSSAALTAPVHGKVVAVKAVAGQEVAEDQAVFVLESMKMEFEVKTRKSGKIAAVHVKIGDQVSAGQELAAWSEA